MADSRSLALLPPRSATHSQTSPTSQPGKSSGDGSFEQKLAKAKKHHAHPAIKKESSAAPVKALAVKTTAKVPAKQAADPSTSPEKPASPKAKVSTPVSEPVTTADETEHEESAKTRPTAAEEDQVAGTVAEKKPTKPAKAPGAKTTQGKADSTQQQPNPNQPVVQSSGTVDPSAVAPVGDDDSPGDKLAGDGKFGSGKVVEAKGTGKANDDSSAVSSSASDTADSANAGAAEAASEAAANAIGAIPTKASAAPTAPSAEPAAQIAGVGLTPSAGNPSTVAGKLPAVAPTPQARFVEENQPQIISSIQGQLMPHGGTLQMRLDPPELGALSVTVHMRDGVMTASFETSNDNATKLLSHSLGQLKSGLEAAGVNVDKIHVEQAPKKESQNNSDSDSKQPLQDQQKQAQQDQQRREMVQRMWRKLAGGDPLDLVA